LSNAETADIAQFREFSRSNLSFRLFACSLRATKEKQMNNVLVRSTIAIIVLVFTGAAFAQMDDMLLEVYSPFDTQEDSSWGMSFNQTDVWENGQYFDRIDNYFYSNDQEPLDEIIVRAKRQAARRMFMGELYMVMDWGLLSSLNYGLATECESIASIDPGTTCFDETDSHSCVTTTYTVQSLTQGQTDELNATYSILLQIDSAAQSLTVGGLTAIFTGGVAPGTATLSSLVATGGSFLASLPDRNSINPFAAGDAFEITMVTCPSTDGFSSPTSSVSVSITGG
jgi:hypothetical protein